MSSQSRQTKGNRKPGPDPPANRRPPAWGQGARSSPTFSPGPARQQQQQQQQQPSTPATPMTFPPLSQPNGARSDSARDRVLQALSGLTGSAITILTKSSQRYEGVLASTTGEGDTTGVTLKDVKEISIPGAPLKDSVFIASTNIESYASGPAEVKPPIADSFRTDTDISQKKGVNARGRELQAWAPTDAPPAPSGTAAAVGDEDTFGPGANGTTPWDQFTANEQLFGVKASFDEDVYTTKLDRSAPDFKDRERRAQKIANEIIGAGTSNPHVAEERGLVDDSGVNEEDRYGAVLRKPGSYVPPGARKAPSAPSTAATSSSQSTTPAPPNATADSPNGAGTPAKTDSVNGPDETPSPIQANKPPADPLPAFRDFVAGERHRLTQKRQALVKSEMDKRMAELVKFSLNFKLNKPIPDDLVPILAKDEDKRQRIKEKSLLDANSTSARTIGASTPATASRGVAVAGTKMSKLVTPALKPSGATMENTNASGSSSTPIVSGGIAAAQKMSSSSNPSVANNTKGTNGSTVSKKIPMVIQDIPPFRGSGGKAKTTVNTPRAAGLTISNGAPPAPGSTSSGNVTKSTSPATETVPLSPTAAVNRLNVNATSFRPNPKANAFNPVVSSPKVAAAAASTVSSPKTKESTPAPTNPFFGRSIKKSTPVHVKDDFNPFKHNKVVDSSQVSALWPFNGKRYMQSYPPLPHPPAQQPPAHIVAPVHPPIPPPSYEEDSAAQAAAARGYVYAYPPYGYQPPHMMPGMGPPGPPGAYMPGPYMQPMPYPPGMPPPNMAMYNPGMGQMPPPQGYMPPPHGAYPPPPPNGGGPRPSMPPTPIPAHAHPYYHSPQMAHAYPMMMPPPNMPPSGPPHGYDGAPAPPVSMGGHA